MRTTGDTVCCMWASQLSFNGTKTANREVVNTKNSAEKRHLMDVRVKWTHIEVEVFCKLIRQFEIAHTHSTTSCWQPYVDYREFHNNKKWTEKGKEQKSSDRFIAFCVKLPCWPKWPRRANWSSSILRLWQLPVRQSNIGDSLEWLMNGMKQRNKIEYWIHHARCFCGQREKNNQQQQQHATETVGRFFVLTAPKPANDIDDENEGFFSPSA